jgi:hypothetical protein
MPASGISGVSATTAMRSRSAGSLTYCSRARSKEAMASTWPLSSARMLASWAPENTTSLKKVFGSRFFTSPRCTSKTMG